ERRKDRILRCFDHDGERIELDLGRRKPAVNGQIGRIGKLAGYGQRWLVVGCVPMGIAEFSGGGETGGRIEGLRSGGEAVFLPTAEVAGRRCVIGGKFRGKEGRVVKRTIFLGGLALGLAVGAEARDWGFDKDTVYTSHP